MTEAALEELCQETRLLTFKGIGYHHGHLLRRLGYRRVKDLAEADPDELFERLDAARPVPFPGPRPGMVCVWVNEASD